MRAALVLSILAHSAAFFAVRPLAGRLASGSPPAEDHWTGTSIEVSLAGPGTGALTGGAAADPASVTEPPAGPTPAASAPAESGSVAPAPSAAPGASAASTASAATTTSTASAAPKKPSPAADSRARDKAPKDPDKPSQNKTSSKGNKAASKGSKAASNKPPPDDTAADKPSQNKGFRLPMMPNKARRGKGAHAPGPSGSAGPVASAAGSSGPSSGAGPGGTFGSEGASSVRDLGRAFTRAVPAACSADPVWATLSSGDKLTLTALVRVDADGHVTKAEPISKDPPKALVNLLKRTIPMLQGGTFAVSGGAVTAGTETVELTAVVSDEPADSEKGARDNLAFSYAAGRGRASFTQTGGRRVDITIHVSHVETSP